MAEEEGFELSSSYSEVQAVPRLASDFDELDSLDIWRSELDREARRLLAHARGLLEEEERILEAEKSARQALSIFRELGDRSSASDALRVVAAALHGREDVEAAENLAQDELERAAECEDTHGEASMLLTLVELNRDRRGSSDYQDVLRCGMEAQATFQELGDRRKVAEVLMGLCDLYLLHGRGGNLMQAANGALSLYRSLQDKREEGRSLHFVAAACGLQRRIPEALKNSLAARGIFQQMQARRLEAAELQAIAQWHQLLNDFKQMLRHAEEAAALLRRLSGVAECEASSAHLQAEAAAMAQVVEAHMQLGDLAEARASAEANLVHFEEKNFRRGKLVALESLVSCHLVQRDTDAALERVAEALELARELKDLRSEASLLLTSAFVRLEAGQHELALEAAREAQALMQDVGDQLGEAAALVGTMVPIHLAMGAEQEAVRVAREAERMYRIAGDRRGQGSAMLVMGRIHQLGGRHAEAERGIRDALAIFEDLADVTAQLQALQALIQICIVCRRPDDATRLADQGHALSQRAKDKKQEVSMLLLMVQGHFSAMKRFADGGGQRPSREFDSLWNKAEKAALAAQKLAGPLGDKELVANASYTLGEVYVLEGRSRETLGCADEAIRLHTEIGNQVGEGTAHVLRAQALRYLNRTDESVAAGERGLALGKASQDAQLQVVAEHLLASLRGAPLPAGLAPQQPALGAEADEQKRQSEEEEARQKSEDEVATSASRALQEQKAALNPDVVEDTLHTMLREMMGSEVESDTPFMDAGVDSLMSIEFRSQVNQAFRGLGLSNTLTFDYPTVRELTAHIVNKSSERP
mmetsp:Transcript_4425/g.16743  ORF Transcript_4425/g.16743 Transcript_4425/m.16743 type:complete len:819 (-) Transcript_4425:72-2528(-)